MENLVNVEKLFILSNKIKKIENLDHFAKVEMLELGANKI